MSTQNRDDAKRIINGIVEHQKTASNKLQNLERQVEDLKTAQRLLVEGSDVKSVPVYEGDEGLRKYISDDGSVNWNSGTITKTINGQRVKVQQDGLLETTEPVNEWHRELVKMVSDRTFARSLQINPHTPKADIKLHEHLSKAPHFMRDQIQRAFDGTTGEGAEWIPSVMQSSLYASFKVPRLVTSLFETIQMDSGSMIFPRLDKGGTPYIRSASVDALTPQDATTVLTNNGTVSAKSFCTLMVLDQDSAEDTAFALLPSLTAQIAADLADAFEDAAINGDTSGSPVDDLSTWNIRNRWQGTLGTAADHRKAFHGLRHQAFDRSATKDYLGSAFTYATLLNLVGFLGERAGGNNALIVSPELMVANLMSLDEVKTLDVFGDKASVISGQIASVAGIPVLVSRFMGADMNTGGLYDDATKTRTGMIAVNRDSYKVFERKSITVEQQKDVASGSIVLSSTYRATLDTLDSSTLKNVAYGFNLPY